MITISAFSDWKCGALTDEQFYSLTARENRRDRDLYEKMSDTENHEYKCDDCKYKDNNSLYIAECSTCTDKDHFQKKEGEAENDT